MTIIDGNRFCQRVAVIAATVSVMLAGCAGIRLDRPLRPSPIDWTMYGGSPARTNESRTPLQPPLEPVWQYNALAGISGTPLVRDSVVLIGTLHGELQAVNLVTGKRLGYASVQSAVAGTPVWDGTFAYVPSAHGVETLACIGLRSGERLWVARLGPIEASLLMHGDHLYVATLEGILYCVTKSDGTVVWQFETARKEAPSSGQTRSGKPIRSAPATDGELVVFGCDDGALYAVDLKSGTLRWKYQTGASIFASPVIVGGRVIVGSLDGNVYCIDLQSGRRQWVYETGSKIYGGGAANAEMAFVGSADGRMHALRLEDGSKAWAFATRSVINSAPLIAGTVVYFGSLDRTLYCLRTDSGEELWRHHVEGRIKVPPVIWGDVLLLTHEDKFVSALRPVPAS